MKIILLATPPTVDVTMPDKNGKMVTTKVPASGYVSLGGGYYDALDSAPEPAISSGPKRYGDLPAADKPKVMLAQVFRSTDTAAPDLKARIRALVQAELTAAGKKITDFTAAQVKTFIRKKLGDRLAAKQEDKVTLVRVPMNAIPATDIEDSTGIIPHQWFGEGDPNITPPPITP